MTSRQRLFTSHLLPLAVVFTLAASPLRAETIDLSDLSLAPNSYFNGPQGTTPATDLYGDDLESGPINSGSPAAVELMNDYETDDGYWTGFAYSNVHDTTIAGYTNQFAAYTGQGVTGPGSTYAIANGYLDQQPSQNQGFSFDPTDPTQLGYLPHMEIPSGYNIESIEVTNSTYAALSMLDGDFFAGAPFGPGDFFKLSIFGTDAEGVPLTNSVNFNLATGSSIVTDWETVNLSSLSGATTLYFNLSSSRVDPNVVNPDSSITYGFGMETPGYFALGEIQIAPVPEPSTFVLLGSAAVGLLFIARRRSRR